MIELPMKVLFPVQNFIHVIFVALCGYDNISKTEICHFTVHMYAGMYVCTCM